MAATAIGCGSDPAPSNPGTTDSGTDVVVENDVVTPTTDNGPGQDSGPGTDVPRTDVPRTDVPRTDTGPSDVPLGPAGRSCEDDSMCGDLVCNPDFFPNGGVCTQECEQGTAAVEQAACGGATSTCLRVPAQNRMTMMEVDASLCVQGCGTTSLRCRDGFACTNLWYGYGADSMFMADSRPGCFPWCTADAQCPTGQLCNTHSGVCGMTGTPTTLRRDGDPCDPTLPTTTRQCRGFCVRVSMDVRTQGICGTLYPQNTRGTAACPDDSGSGMDYPFLSAMAFGVTPVAGEQIGVCIYRSCATNADCTGPLVCGDQMVCEYPTGPTPTDAGTDAPRTDAPAVDAGPATDVAADRPADATTGG